jgi:hypothetical protein
MPKFIGIQGVKVLLRKFQINLFSNVYIKSWYNLIAELKVYIAENIYNKEVISIVKI